MLFSALASLDLEELYEKKWKSIEIPSDEYLHRHVVNILGPPKEFDNILWFHCTRTIEKNRFKNGILPLGEVLPEIWDTLFALAENDEIRERLKNLQRNGVPNFHFSNKNRNDLHWGPYAILVKEVAAHATRLCQHDYLAMPEIIEDICNGYEKKYGYSIIEEYQKKLKPCIVKFSAPEDSDSFGNTIAALSYAYTCVRKKEVGMNAVTCFDGNNQKIPSENIISIEYIP